ncbi:MAG: GNAT family N-acetyltransferase [Oligoflexales bacterium]
MEWTYKDYTFRTVETFEEPLFSELMKKVFFEEFPSIDMKQVLSEQEKQKAAEFRNKFKDRYHLRIAVYHGPAFVGWTFGWQESDHSFYMGMSAVLPEHRNKGIYTELVSAVLKITREEGFQSVYSNHLVANSNVLIPKLKLGFTIAGMEMLEWVGLVVKLVFYHQPTRKDIYQYRVGMAPPSEVIKKLLGYN